VECKIEVDLGPDKLGPDARVEFPIALADLVFWLCAATPRVGILTLLAAGIVLAIRETLP
jgi:hypothetical protein